MRSLRRNKRLSVPDMILTKASWIASANHQLTTTRRDIPTHSKMKTTYEYKAAIADAVAFKHEYPDENCCDKPLRRG